MTQKDVFERIYNIILSRGSKSAINSLDLMYNSFINKPDIDAKDLENVNYIYNEFIVILNDTQKYKNSIFNRGATELDLAFFEKQKISKEHLVKDLSIVKNTETIFFDKTVVITGVFSKFIDRNILAVKLKELGADINTSISKKTDIVCLGWDGVGPKKMEKIKELKDSGIEIRLVYEDELYSILLI
jgi:NAD-dependent DNA ligase